MQMVLCNTDALPMVVEFDDGSVVSLEPDDTLTLEVNAGSGVVVQADSVQTHGIVSPPYSATDSEITTDLLDETDEMRRRREDREDFRPDSNYTT